MIDLGEDDDKFDQFVAPLTAQFEILKTAFLSQDPAIYNADEAKVRNFCFTAKILN